MNYTRNPGSLINERHSPPFPLSSEMQDMFLYNRITANVNALPSLYPPVSCTITTFLSPSVFRQPPKLRLKKKFPLQVAIQRDRIRENIDVITIARDTNAFASDHRGGADGVEVVDGDGAAVVDAEDGGLAGIRAGGLGACYCKAALVSREEKWRAERGRGKGEESFTCAVVVEERV